MAEPQDAVFPILQKIQDEIAAGRKDVNALRAKVDDMAENILDMKDEISGIRSDFFMHFGVTARHRVDFEELRNEVADVKKRIAALESRS